MKGRRVKVSALLAGGLILWAGAANPAAVGSIPQFLTVFGADWQRPDLMADRYAAAIWHNHPSLRGFLSQMKIRSPQTKGFMYRELFCVQRHETELEETVGSYDWIDAYHPDWFQLDVNGRRVEISDFPGRWMMDMSHPGYRAFWINETLKDVQEGGWDGVFADDALTTLRAHSLPPLAGIPDDAALQDTVIAFLAEIHAAFQPAGKLVVANVSNTYDYPGLWDRLLGVTDGLLEEHFAGASWNWGEAVAARQLQALRAADARGKWALLMTYGPWEDRAAMMTSLAAYLLAGGPKTVWTYRPSSGADTPAWDASWQLGLGQPTGALSENQGVYQRPFQNGTAVVNTTSTARSVSTPHGSVSLAPKQGAIVR